MLDVWSPAKGVLETIAPLLASAVGGPLAGTAAHAITGALGLPSDMPTAEIAAAVQAATPEHLLALKGADAAFRTQMKQLEVDERRLGSDDTKDVLAQIVAPAAPHSPLEYGTIIVTLTILGLYAAVTMGWTPALSDGTLKLLDTALTLVLGYWLGSSRGSASKDAALANSVPIGSMPGATIGGSGA